MKTNTNTNNRNYKMKYEGEHPSIHENRKHTVRMIVGGVSTVMLIWAVMLVGRGWLLKGIVWFAVWGVVLSWVSLREADYYERYGEREELREDEDYDGSDLYED